MTRVNDWPRLDPARLHARDKIVPHNRIAFGDDDGKHPPDMLGPFFLGLPV
jgi:hypothetical protein